MQARPDLVLGSIQSVLDEMTSVELNLASVSNCLATGVGTTADLPPVDCCRRYRMHVRQALKDSNTVPAAGDGILHSCYLGLCAASPEGTS